MHANVTIINIADLHISASLRFSLSSEQAVGEGQLRYDLYDALDSDLTWARLDAQRLSCYFGGRLSLALLASPRQCLRDSLLFTHNRAALPLLADPIRHGYFQLSSGADSCCVQICLLHHWRGNRRESNPLYSSGNPEQTLGSVRLPGVRELHVCANLEPRPFHPSIIRFANSTLVSFSQREGRWSKTVGKKFTV